MSKRLYIIDGHGQIYSAFYAPTGGQLSSAAGEPTNATLIFTTMILKLLRERKPDKLVVAMDSPGPTFRHQLFKQYKANRPPMPEELRPQIQRIEEILNALRIPILRQKGFEADDIIGTLATQAAARHYGVFICSKDKDLEQILSDKVVMYDPKSDEVLNVEALQAKKGIQPDQVVDVLALMGDTVDNVPGVADVGPKTAQQWIQKYGSLDELLAHQDQITGKRGENLRASLEQLKLSRQLVTIKRDMPTDFDWNEMDVKAFDAEKLQQIFEQLGFRRLLSQLEEICGGKSKAPGSDQTAKADRAQPTPPPTKAEGAKAQTGPTKAHYLLVNTAEAFEDFYQKLSRQKCFSLDTETTSINPVNAELVGLSFSWQSGQGYYLPVKAPLGQECLDRDQTLAKLKKILTDPKVQKVGQNIKYDSVVLRRAGIELAGVVFDTMVASYVLESERARHNLDSLAWDFLGHETIKLEELIGKGKNQITFDAVDLDKACDYSAEDAEVTWRLYECLNERLSRQGDLKRLFEEVEMPLVAVLAEMEYQGVALDVPVLKKLDTQLANRLEKLELAIHKAAGCDFNVDSPKQLSKVLFEKLGLKSVKKTKSGVSTDQEVLEALRWQHPVAELMLEYRQLSKLKNTYLATLPGMISPSTGRLHASFNQTVAATGRLSSSNPNLQNIPIRTAQGQEIRRGFVAQEENGVLLAADYSQIELRLLAHFSQDAQLLKAFAQGQDIHRFVASEVFQVPLEAVEPAQRTKAKAVNFGIIYGQTAYGLSRSIGISVSEAKTFIDAYFNRYPAIQTFMDQVITQARQDGYVQTILGRRRNLADLKSHTASRRQLAERMAVNTVIQGSAADMIKVAMIHIHQRIKKEKLAMKMILQVHDELVFEMDMKHANNYSQIIQKEMTTAIKVDVPITVDIGVGKNWLECK